MMRALMIGLCLSLWAAPVAAKSPGSLNTVEAEIKREAVERVFHLGAQQVVASVEVRAALAQGKFIGFRIVKFNPKGLLTTCEKLLPGDVILAINGHKLERPDEFMRAWETVKKAPAIEVLVLRNTRKTLYRWTIVP